MERVRRGTEGKREREREGESEHWVNYLFSAAHTQKKHTHTHGFLRILNTEITARFNGLVLSAINAFMLKSIRSCDTGTAHVHGHSICHLLGEMCVVCVCVCVCV